MSDFLISTTLIIEKSLKRVTISDYWPRGCGIASTLIVVHFFQFHLLRVNRPKINIIYYYLYLPETVNQSHLKNKLDTLEGSSAIHFTNSFANNPLLISFPTLPKYTGQFTARNPNLTMNYNMHFNLSENLHGIYLA